MKRNDLPECFGRQGLVMIQGDLPIECMECDVFDKCHKITVSACVLGIYDCLDLMIQNGLLDGKLKNIEEIDEIVEAAEAKAKRKRRRS